jgi:hypothetical protein
VPVLALRVEIVAQARHYSRVVPGTGTILTGPGRAWTVLFRAVPGLTHRVSAKWSSIPPARACARLLSGALKDTIWGWLDLRAYATSSFSL